MQQPVEQSISCYVLAVALTCIKTLHSGAYSAAVLHMRIACSILLSKNTSDCCVSNLASLRLLCRRL